MVLLKCKLPPSHEMCLVFLKMRLISFESFLVSRECTVSATGLHSSNTQSQCLNTMSDEYYQNLKVARLRHDHLQ